MNIKKLIADCIGFQIDDVNYESLIIESVSSDKGDYSLPCFSFAKLLHDSPINIANKILESVDTTSIIEKCEVVAGYLNFFLNKGKVGEIALKDINVTNISSSEGKNKVVCLDYGSPNLAKFLHIGHLKSLIEGESIARLFELKGYTIKRLDFTGDYGTPFGKIIGGLLKWGSLDEVKARGNDALQEYYVKFNQAEEQDTSYTDYARELFKKIEDHDKEIYPIYEFVIDIASKDEKKMFDILGVNFDDHRGEMYYNQFVPNVIKLLDKKGVLTDSEGAKIVNLEKYDMPPAIVIKSDGTTIYMTRDISAAIDRYNDYKIDKMIYVTDVAQSLHFQQLFKILEMAGYKFASNMEHMAYGRFSLPDGKIASRRGKQAVLVDLLEYASNKAKDVIADRKFEIENPENVVKKVARAVLNYSVLKVERTKDCVFDVEKAFSFDGETAPYMMYTFTRLKSILRKYKQESKEIDYSCLNNDAFELIKNLITFEDTLNLSLEKLDASIVAKRVMDICKLFNKFYTSSKVIDGNSATTNAKIELVRATQKILEVGFRIICIDTLEEM